MKKLFALLSLLACCASTAPAWGVYRDACDLAVEFRGEGLKQADILKDLVLKKRRGALSVQEEMQMRFLFNRLVRTDKSIAAFGIVVDHLGFALDSLETVRLELTKLRGWVKRDPILRELKECLEFYALAQKYLPRMAEFISLSHETEVLRLLTIGSKKIDRGELLTKVDTLAFMTRFMGNYLVTEINQVEDKYAAIFGFEGSLAPNDYKTIAPWRKSEFAARQR